MNSFIFACIIPSPMLALLSTKRALPRMSSVSDQLPQPLGLTQSTHLFTLPRDRHT